MPRVRRSHSCQGLGGENVPDGGKAREEASEWNEIGTVEEQRKSIKLGGEQRRE